MIGPATTLESLNKRRLRREWQRDNCCNEQPWPTGNCGEIIMATVISTLLGSVIAIGAIQGVEAGFEMAR